MKVTLQDCLACSGCVTSAETVLLEHQSIAEFTSKLGVCTSAASAQPCLRLVLELDLCSRTGRAFLIAFRAFSSSEARSQGSTYSPAWPPSHS